MNIACAYAGMAIMALSSVTPWPEAIFFLGIGLATPMVLDIFRRAFSGGQS